MDSPLARIIPPRASGESLLGSPRGGWPCDMAWITIIRSSMWKKRNATTMLPITVTVGTDVVGVVVMSMTSGMMSKKDTAISAPAAKAKKYLTGILVLLRVNRPPISVEKKLTTTKNRAKSDWAI